MMRAGAITIKVARTLRLPKRLRQVVAPAPVLRAEPGITRSQTDRAAGSRGRACIRKPLTMTREHGSLAESTGDRRHVEYPDPERVARRAARIRGALAPAEISRQRLRTLTGAKRS